MAAPQRSGAPAGTVDTVIVGAGHSGLAMSRCLSERSVDHVVLERGEIAHSWHHERWDSLRLLTPNWQSRLPGYCYDGPDPDGYMTMPEIAAFIDRYARSIDAPVRTGTTVTSVLADGDGYRVVTEQGHWRCRTVVIASGAHSLPNLPRLAEDFPSSAQSLTVKDYRNPDRLDARGVLIVGASATGLQLADEIQRSGRRVTLAVGEHIRMPRLYRGRDIQCWLAATGILDERWDEVDDIVRARRVPSPQLIGTPERTTLDLNSLRARGVEIVGRFVGISDGKAQFSGSLANYCAMADLKLARLLRTIDTWAERNHGCAGLGTPERIQPTFVDQAPRLRLDLQRERIGTVIWATGFRADYSWLHVPAFDRSGRLCHDGGVVKAPGMYVLGLNFMRRRKSSLLYGAEDDAVDLSAHLLGYLKGGAHRSLLRAAS